MAMASTPDTTSKTAIPVNAATQAGGGVPAKAVPKTVLVETLNPLLLAHAKHHYDTISKETNLSSYEGFKEWITKSQGGTDEDSKAVYLSKDKQYTFDDFVAYLKSADALGPAPLLDVDYPISSYFISSSHNTYLTGNQLYSDSSTDAYVNVLLRGCRCVEIDVHNGDEPSDSEEEETGTSPKKKGLRERLREKISKKTSSSSKHGSEVHTKSASPSPPHDASEVPKPPRKTSTIRAEPRVLHGYTATKEISFRSVCETIRDYAFVTSNFPLIVSLEVHTSLEQQAVMVEIMEEYWKGMLVELPTAEQGKPEIDPLLPPLKDLYKKILIKVKYSPPKPPSAQPEPTTLIKIASPPSDTSSSPSSSSDDEAPVEPVAKPPKVLDALSRLGVYTRSYHFSGFDKPEAKVPTHVFSISERKLMEVHENQSKELFTHNKHFLMRTYPHGLRVSSSNLDPSLFWRKGVQIVALNWQRWDAGMMLNEAMFAGYEGWVLKPDGFRHNSNADNQQSASIHLNLNLTIEFLAGQDLPLPVDEDSAKGYKPYVKVELHVEKPEERQSEPIPGGGKSKEGEYKARTKTEKGQNPDFHGEKLTFTDVPGVVPELSFLRFKVMDDHLRDDLAAWACYRLDRLQPGLRMIHLFNGNGAPTKGILFVKITKRLGPAPRRSTAIKQGHEKKLVAAMQSLST